MTFSWLHPAWQWTSTEPSRPSLIDSDGLASSWAGHFADQPPAPQRVPPSAVATSSA
jgi:hypothetical protein